MYNNNINTITNKDDLYYGGQKYVAVHMLGNDLSS